MKCCEQELEDNDTDLCILDNIDVMQSINTENDDFRFPSPVKNTPTNTTPESESRSAKPERQQSGKVKKTIAEPCGRKSMTAIRKSPTRSMKVARLGAHSARVGN